MSSAGHPSEAPSSDDFDDFEVVDPRSLMTAEEWRQARSLRQRLDRVLEARAESWTAPRDAKREQRLNQRREQIDREIDELAAEVLAREFGLHRYMVIELKQRRLPVIKMQVLTFGVSPSRFRNPPMWELHGRRLRQDGTIGERAEYAYIDWCRVRRRCLDGTWQTLHLRNEEADDATDA